MDDDECLLKEVVEENEEKDDGIDDGCVAMFGAGELCGGSGAGAFDDVFLG